MKRKWPVTTMLGWGLLGLFILVIVYTTGSLQAMAKALVALMALVIIVWANGEVQKEWWP